MNGIVESRPRLIIWQVALAAVALGAWEWGAASKRLDPFFFSRPSEILLRVVQWTGTGAIWVHLSTTFTEAILSFVIGGFLGVLLGFTLAGMPIVAAVLEPYIRMANALPRVVLAALEGDRGSHDQRTRSSGLGCECGVEDVGPFTDDAVPPGAVVGEQAGQAEAAGQVEHALYGLSDPWLRLIRVE